MKNIFCLIFFTLLSISCQSQNSKDYNFGFESITGNTLLSDGWFSWGNNKVKIESTLSHSGKKSVSIQSDTTDRTGGMAYILINSYRGKEVTLEGYIKTKNVENSAGLFITFEDQQEIQIESKDIKTENLNGTADWKKYTVTAIIPENSNKIMMGGFLKGKGKALFDQFKLYIDGKNIQELSPQDLSQSPDEFFLDSQFKINNLNKQQIDNLYQLGKTWGYLKYHSPENSKGNLNWDYELFRFLPNINSKNFDALLYSWSRSFSTALKTDIKENYYIDWVPNEGNPIFKNEESYPRMKWNDDGMKLLALFRYWNSINYFFPYKDLIGKNWDLVLKDYIPKIVHTDDELSYKLVLLELTKEINDTHAGIYDFGSIIDEFYGINEAPLKTRFIGDQLVIIDISKQNTTSGFAVGDIITEINHKKVNDLLAEKAKYIPASNKAALLRDISSIILKTNENDIVITIQHNNGRLSDMSLKTIPGQDVIVEKNIPTHKELDHNIGYIYPAVITKEEIHTVMKKFMNKKGIIIDLRCYPKEFSASILSDYFFPTSKEFAQFKATSLQDLGKFEVNGNAKIGKTNRNYYKGKVAILVDETTQSASEFIVMALRTAPKSVVIGSQTAGADGDISKILLPGGVSTSISGLGVYYPNGKGTQRTGVSIDIQVKQSLQSIRNGEDPLIEKAIEFINQ